MGIVRMKKHKHNFVIIDKVCLNDVRLSWQATGLLGYFMGLPDDWQVNVADLSKRKTNGKSSLASIIAELERHGYVTKKRSRAKVGGKFTGWDYTVYEEPKPDSPKSEKPISV